MPITIPLETHVTLGPQKAVLDGRDLAKAWCHVGGGTLEAAQQMPVNTIQVCTKQNLLVQAVHMAFYEHLPLVLSPDIIWVTILQGLANHIANDPEGLRKHFVEHEGKKQLQIVRPDFVKGSADNDWQAALDDFIAEIGKNIGMDKAGALSSDFSTTGPCERAVAAVSLMDSMQHYFEYEMLCGCGFPSITLTGTVGDWERIREKASSLKEYELDWWLEVLLPVLDQFVLAAKGKAETNFWRSLCNCSGLSGGYNSPVSGWIQAFYPYLNGGNFGGPGNGTEASRKLPRNEHMAAYQGSHLNGVNILNYWGAEGPGGMFSEPEKASVCGWQVGLDRFPPAVSSAPFTYTDLRVFPEVKYRMKVLGGVSCIVQDPGTRAIEPKLTWAVVDLGKVGAE